MAEGLGYIQDRGIHSTILLLFTVRKLQTLLPQLPALMIVEHYMGCYKPACIALCEEAEEFFLS